PQHQDQAVPVPPTSRSRAFAPSRREPPFFACAKKPGAKKAHPACAPGALHRVRGAGGIFRGGILPPRKTPHIPVRRPAGLVRRLRRFGGAPEVKIKGNSASRRAARFAVGRGYAPDTRTVRAQAWSGKGDDPAGWPRRPRRSIPLLPSGPGGVFVLASRGADGATIETCARIATREKLAERGGFEPPKRGLDAYTLSRRAPSTTRTPLRWNLKEASGNAQGRRF